MIALHRHRPTSEVVDMHNVEHTRHSAQVPHPSNELGKL